MSFFRTVGSSLWTRSTAWIHLWVMNMYETASKQEGFILILFTFSQLGSHPLFDSLDPRCASHLHHFDFLTCGGLLDLRGLSANSYLVDESVPSLPF